MSLLREIQQAAIEEHINIATLLRKCKVLAARLGSQEFENWIDNELNGYKNLDELPSYREFRVRSYGDFVGAFGRQGKNLPIPLEVFPEEIRDYVETMKLAMAISSLASLAEPEEGLRESWPPEVIRIMGDKIYEDMNCLSAWKALSRAALIGVLDTVRTRILNFVLQIEKDYPDAGEAPINSTPVPEERVSQVFNTYISGTVQNLATGSSHLKQQAHFASGPSDAVFSKLLDAITEASANQEVIEKMGALVEEMRGSQGTSSFKTHYLSFMSLLADHMQVFGPLVVPFLPTLALIAS